MLKTVHASNEATFSAMKSLFANVTMLGMGVLLVQQAEAHLFTDDQGRQVEAEVAGMRGENVILATQGVRGQWPVARTRPQWMPATCV